MCPIGVSVERELTDQYRKETSSYPSPEPLLGQNVGLGRGRSVASQNPILFKLSEGTKC